MRRYNILIFLVILSVSALFNISMAWWPNAGSYSAAISEISSTPVAQAAEVARAPAQTSQGEMPEAERETSVLIATAEASVFSGSIAGDVSQEEAEVLLNLRTIKENLDMRSKALDERQSSVEKAEEGMAARIKELESLVARMQDQLQQEQSFKSKKIKKLAAVYSSMKPEKAAPVVTRMELGTVVKMFARMDDKKVGKILSFLTPEKAVSITQALTRQSNDL
jgi:flagellar motility protein MotE (MotC chaperone)